MLIPTKPPTAFLAAHPGLGAAGQTSLFEMASERCRVLRHFEGATLTHRDLTWRAVWVTRYPRLKVGKPWAMDERRFARDRRSGHPPAWSACC